MGISCFKPRLTSLDGEKMGILSWDFPKGSSDGILWFYPTYILCQWEPGGFCGCSQFYGPKSDIRSQFIRAPNILKGFNHQIFFIVHVMCIWMNELNWIEVKWIESNRIELKWINYKWMDGWMDGWMDERTNKRMNKYNVEDNYTVCLYEYIHTNKPSNLSPNPLFYSSTTFGIFSFVADAAILLAGLAMTAKPLRPTLWCFLSQTDWWYSSSFLLEVNKKHFQNIRFVGGIIHILWMYMKPILLVFERRCEMWVRIYQFCFHLQYLVPCT